MPTSSFSSSVIDRQVRACVQLMPLKKNMCACCHTYNQCDSRLQEHVLFPNPQPRELVSANVATLLDQTVERLVTGNRTG